MEDPGPIHKNLLVVSLFVHDMKAPLSVVGSGAKKLSQDLIKGDHEEIGIELADKILEHKQKASVRLNQILDMDSNVDLACDIESFKGKVPIWSRIVNRVRKNRDNGTKGDGAEKPNLCHAIYELKVHLSTMMEFIDAFEIQAADAAFGHKETAVLKRIKRNAKTSIHLADNAIAILESYESNVSKTVCPVSHIVHPAILEVFDLLEPQISESIHGTWELNQLQEIVSRSHIYIDVEEAFWGSHVCCDQEKVTQVIVNLLLNAMKFRKKKIHLGVAAKGKNTIFSVTDDGKGIPKADQPYIFENRFQVKSEKAFPIRGHGIGLAGAQALLESMGGELSLDSSSGDKTCFKALLKN